MRISSDACILGGVANHESPTSILDIGTGTGLLALMLAQKYNCPITALEIEPNAIEEAGSNFHNSPFTDQINLVPKSVQTYASEYHQTYDLIICNPPFFKNSLKSDNQSKQLARHQDTLGARELAQSVKKLLSPEGIFYVLYPVEESNHFLEVASDAAVLLQEQILISNMESTKTIRAISVFANKPANPVLKKPFIIRNSDNSYHANFKQILTPYFTIF